MPSIITRAFLKLDTGSNLTMLSHLMLKNNLCGRRCEDPRFVSEETEIQNGIITWPLASGRL